MCRVSGHSGLCISRMELEVIFTLRKNIPGTQAKAYSAYLDRDYQVCSQFQATAMVADLDEDVSLPTPAQGASPRRYSTASTLQLHFLN